MAKESPLARLAAGKMADDRGDGAAPSKAVPRRGTEIGERALLFAYDRDSAMLRDDGCVIGAASRLVSPCILQGSSHLRLRLTPARTARVMPLFFVPVFLFFFSLLFFLPFIRNIKPPGSFESLGINRRKREPRFRMHDVQGSITLIMRCEFVNDRAKIATTVVRASSTRR